jgi:hypothetical protein
MTPSFPNVRHWLLLTQVGTCAYGSGMNEQIHIRHQRLVEGWNKKLRLRVHRNADAAHHLLEAYIFAQRVHSGIHPDPCQST